MEQLNRLLEVVKEQIEEYAEEHDIRVCSICGKLMDQGYCLDSGARYYCSDECLHTEFTDEEWNKECEENEDSYWTEWEEQ